MNCWTETELVEGCRAGRTEAFDELVRSHYDRLYRLAWALAGPEAAADLVQETFLSAVKAFPRFRGDARLSTWLISILRNQTSLFLRGVRKWKLAPISEERDRIAAPELPPLDQEVGDILERVRELPDELRIPLILFHVDGMKYAEIARALECPIGTVRSRLFEARDRLRKLVAGAGRT